MIPKEFSPLKEISKTIRLRADYATTENFVGDVVDGYHSKNLVILNEVFEGLKKAEKKFNQQGLSIVVYDSYRPVKAVEHFEHWAKDDCEKTKEIYYPHLTKAEIFEQGFIASRSSHSKGIAIDMSVYSMDSGEELDMGTIFDFFDEASYTESEKITQLAHDNRLLMIEVMTRCGFKNFSKEWWHFSYLELFDSEKYWDFDII